MKINYWMQYKDVTRNPTANNMKIIMLSYISEKWSDYDKICYTESGSDSW